MHLVTVYRVLTELTIVVHLAFIAFVVAGAILVRHRRWLMPLHLAALAWAVYAELSSGVVCPLTVVENFFAVRARIESYSGDFVAHYLIPVIYQEGLRQTWQYALVAAVLALNVIVYASLLWRTNRDTHVSV